MVGHTGSLPLRSRPGGDGSRGGELLNALAKVGGRAVICADHGNAEQMWDPTVNGPHTSHTLNPLSVFVVGEGFEAEQGEAAQRRRLRISHRRCSVDGAAENRRR